jgi:hypothetical protein
MDEVDIFDEAPSIDFDALNDAKTRRKSDAPGGPDTKNTPARIELVKRALSVGHDYETAARFAGICSRTLGRWRKDDPELSRELERVRANADVAVAAILLQRIRSGNVPAITFYLQRRCEAWREKSEVDVTTNTGVMVAPADEAPEDWIERQRKANVERVNLSRN